MDDPHSLGLTLSWIRFENKTLTGWVQVYREAKYSDAPTLMPQGLYIKYGKSKRIYSMVNAKCSEILLGETYQDGGFRVASIIGICITRWKTFGRR